MSEIQNIQVSTHGAELLSLVVNNREYLWQGDPQFWGRRAPILFPIVGRLADDTLRVDGKEYSMKQQGIARDAEFVQEGENYYQMVETTYSNYPYDFDLSMEYHIECDTLSCLWIVQNKGNKDMHFQIGAHPAFLLPDYDANDECHALIKFYDKDGQAVSPLIYNHLVDGLRCSYGIPMALSNNNGILAINKHTFANDALLIEGRQVESVALHDKFGHPVLTVSCPQADAFGLWAPNKPGFPFICIEPWCGIADRDNFNGDVSERDYNHSLASGNSFMFNYSIQIHI